MPLVKPRPNYVSPEEMATRCVETPARPYEPKESFPKNNTSVPESDFSGFGQSVLAFRAAACAMIASLLRQENTGPRPATEDEYAN